MTKKKRLELIQEAKEMGLKSITLEGITYELREEFKKVDAQIVDADSAGALKALLRTPFDELTDDEILYYATPYFDELQHNKKVREQQLKDEGVL